MSSPNTTSSSIGNDLLAQMRTESGLPYELPKDLQRSPTASDKPTEKIVSIFPIEAMSEPAISAESPLPENHDVTVHDDADVQEYMNRLLKRSSSSQTPTDAKSEPTPATPAPIVPVAEPQETVWDAKEFVPRSVAPEKKANLTALREVANQSHRSAIETSVRQRLQVKSLKYFGLTGASLAFGILFMCMSARIFDVSMISGIASFIFAGVTSYQLWLSSRAGTAKQDQAK